MLHKYNEERSPFNSNAAQRVLELGYSENVVKLAMGNLEHKGEICKRFCDNHTFFNVHSIDLHVLVFHIASFSCYPESVLQ